MKWIKLTLALVVLAAVISAVVVALLPKPIPVEIATVEQGPLRVTIDEDGRTRVQDRYVITSPLTGNLGRIELEPGAEVDDAKVIARIEPIPPPLLDARAKSELEARVHVSEASLRQSSSAIARAETRLTYTKRQVERLRGLGNNVAAEELDTAALEAATASKERDSAKFAARVAQHELEMSKAALVRSTLDSTEQFEIRSPVVGSVLKIIRESEGVVVAGEPLMEVADPRALEIVVDVLTSDAVEIAPGDPVVIERWGGEGTLDAHVRLVEPSAFTKVSSLGVEEQRVNVIVALDDPYKRWRALGDGYAVEAAIVVWQDDAAVQVPTSALVRTVEGWSVFVLEGEQAHLRTVSIGRRGLRAVQITEGLVPGETVIVHPTDRVKHGVAVEPL
ncbi:MAG: HlyD family efflux transporter periplasmic adaptor subunit [Deltaproteobacteria bacterium]|nr:HlyD family efflux transporter periplasmic adaptor subunit [Nannocystaceae bacterium]